MKNEEGLLPLLRATEDIVAGLTRLRHQRLVAVYACWDASARSNTGWWRDGGMALAFERDRLDIWSPGPGACFALNFSNFEPEESFDSGETRIVWRQDPWLELRPIYGKVMLGLNLLFCGDEPLALRLTFETGSLCVFAENDETGWTLEPVPPWACQWSELTIF